MIATWLDIHHSCEAITYTTQYTVKRLHILGANPDTKSSVITSEDPAAGIGWYGPSSIYFFVVLYWQMGHPLTTLYTTIVMFGHHQCRRTCSNVFHSLKCPANIGSYAFNTSLYRSISSFGIHTCPPSVSNNPCAFIFRWSLAHNSGLSRYEVYFVSCSIASTSAALLILACGEGGINSIAPIEKNFGVLLNASGTTFSLPLIYFTVKVYGSNRSYHLNCLYVKSSPFFVSISLNAV